MAARVACDRCGAVLPVGQHAIRAEVPAMTPLGALTVTLELCGDCHALWQVVARLQENAGRARALMGSELLSDAERAERDARQGPGRDPDSPDERLMMRRDGWGAAVR